MSFMAKLQTKANFFPDFGDSPRSDLSSLVDRCGGATCNDASAEEGGGGGDERQRPRPQGRRQRQGAHAHEVRPDLLKLSVPL